MKTKKTLELLSLFLCIISIISCGNDENEGRRVTDYREYILTVASAKIPGVVTSCGNINQMDVYAVMKEPSTEWEAFESIGGFEYESGYEYRIRISKTNYLDYSMGEPQWTEYDLLEVISKEEKTSKNLPYNLIPNWYYENYCTFINPEYQYGIDAEQKEIIENDIKSNSALSFGGLHYYITPGGKNWFLLDNGMKTIAQGYLKKINIDNYTELPESYKILPLKGNMLGCMQCDFIKDVDSEESVMKYDVFFSTTNSTTKSFDRPVFPWLYKDLTAYYQNKFPEAGVKAVVIRYTLSPYGKLRAIYTND